VWNRAGERSRQHAKKQRIEIALSNLKRVFHLGETLATTLVGLATRIAAKVAAYIYAFLINRRLGRQQGRINVLTSAATLSQLCNVGVWGLSC
jgi:hypothetical protein